MLIKVTGSVGTSRWSTMQGLVVVGLTVEISNVDKNVLSHWSAKYRSMSVKVPAASVHLREALCKVWLL